MNEICFLRINLAYRYIKGIRLGETNVKFGQRHTAFYTYFNCHFEYFLILLDDSMFEQRNRNGRCSAREPIHKYLYARLRDGEVFVISKPTTVCVNSSEMLFAETILTHGRENRANPVINYKF